MGGTGDFRGGDGGFGGRWRNRFRWAPSITQERSCSPIVLSQPIMQPGGNAGLGGTQWQCGALKGNGGASVTSVLGPAFTTRALLP